MPLLCARDWIVFQGFGLAQRRIMSSCANSEH